MARRKAGRLICLKWKNGFLSLSGGHGGEERSAGGTRGRKKTAALEVPRFDGRTTRA